MKESDQDEKANKNKSMSNECKDNSLIQEGQEPVEAELKND